MYIYLNGDIVEDKDAKISPFDYGYLYGIGLFETIRIYEKHPFLLDDHLDRINNALHELNFDFAFRKSEVLSIIEQLLERNDWENASIRLNISGGVGEPALRTLTFNEPTILVYGSSLPKPGEELRQKDARILSIKRNSPEGAERWKSHHFMNNLLAKQEVADPSIEGIFLSAENHIAEGVTSNVFWVKGETVFTPSIETGILNGITRQYVMTLCEKLGIQVEKGRFKRQDLLEADECFVTNSIQEITAIRSIEGNSFSGSDGIITRELFSNYVQDRLKRWTRRA